MMRYSILKRNQTKTMRGVASVEFTILMAFLYIPLVMGTVEIARVFYQYNTLTKSVRESVKYVSLTSVTQLGYNTEVRYAKCLAAFGNIGCTGSPLVPFLNLNPAATPAERFAYIDPIIRIDTTNAGSPGTVAIKLVTVTVTGYQLGYVSNFFTGGFKAFNDISATMRQATT